MKFVYLFIHVIFLCFQLADSFNFNPHKWMMVNFDCSALWMKDCYAVADAFNVDPLYLRHKHDQSVIDFRVCGVILSMTENIPYCEICYKVYKKVWVWVCVCVCCFT